MCGAYLNMQINQKSFIPYGKQQIDEDDISSVVNVLKSPYLTTGPAVTTFENQLSSFTTAKHVVVVNSGTAALHLAILSLDIGAGDWVIVPSITFLATANAVRLCGAEVIFADVDATTGLMSGEILKDIIDNNKDKKIKAVLLVHLAGQTENMKKIHEISRDHGLYIIEDACHALGGAYIEGNIKYPIGSCRYSDISIFSSHPVKTIAAGEGGALTTNNSVLEKRMRLFLNHGMTRVESDFLICENAFNKKNVNSWYYEMHELGLNYRLSDINCALASSQLKKLKSFFLKRKALVNYYDSTFLKESNNLISPLKKLGYSDPSWHIYSVLIDFEQIAIDRDELMRDLKKNNIGTQVHYIPVYKQPYYKSRYGNIINKGAELYYKKTITLPLYVAMSVEDIDYIVSTLLPLLEKK